MGENIVNPEVTVVMPCLNEAETLATCIEKLSKHSNPIISWEKFRTSNETKVSWCSNGGRMWWGSKK
jgi:hypothetical protein